MTTKTREKDYILLVERIILISSPLILLLVQSVIAGKNLFISIPVWSDELEYWREMYSFSQHGFNFGGSDFVGLEPQIGPLGGHSISPIFAWGLFGPLFRSKMGIYAILWANIFMFVVALFTFVLVVKPDRKLTAASIAIFTLYPMMIHYLNTSMMEMMCISGITIFFSVFYKWNLASNNGLCGEANKWFYILMFVGIWCMCLRITYVVILFPVIRKKCNYSFGFKAIAAMCVYVVGFGIFYKLYNVFCAGYPDWTTQKVANAEGVSDKLYILINNTKLNLSRFFSPVSSDRVQVGMRYFYFLLMIFILVLALESINTVGKMNYLYLDLGITMLCLLVMMIILYDIMDWRDFRAFAPIALGIFIFTMCCENRNFVHGILGALFVFLVVMNFSSGVDSLEGRETTTKKAIEGSVFDKLETVDENGKARAIGTDWGINWGNIDFMQAVPAKLGIKVFWYGIHQLNIEDVDYLFISNETYESDRELFDRYEFVEDVENWGVIIKTY